MAADPSPFLKLRVADGPWLERALPTLIAASDACEIDGGQLMHFDVRSDNICFRRGSALLVDWNLAAIGTRRLDVAFWLPSLQLEGGPAPENVLPDADCEAAVVSGFFASRAGLPGLPGAPGVRPVQLAQLRHALPWACRALGIGKP
ncbi:MAG: hypothetical protein LC792_14700 [Actinobacteria bacterium]|nr:hypothetical protein [Actinomycetota bacterium]